MAQKKIGTIMQTIRFKSELSEKELLKKAREREPQFQAISGIVQKYYVKIAETGEFGGVYIWDNAESLAAFRSSELAASIPKAYKIIGKPTVEIIDILFSLRE